MAGPHLIERSVHADHISRETFGKTGFETPVESPRHVMDWQRATEPNHFSFSLAATFCCFFMTRPSSAVARLIARNPSSTEPEARTKVSWSRE